MVLSSVMGVDGEESFSSAMEYGSPLGDCTALGNAMAALIGHLGMEGSLFVEKAS